MYLHVREAESRNRAPYFFNIGRLGVIHLHQRASRELHRQMQAAGKQKKHCQCKCGEADQIKNQSMPHERNVFTNLEKFHGMSWGNGR